MFQTAQMSSWQVSKKLTRTTENQSKDVNFYRIQSGLRSHSPVTVKMLSLESLRRGGVKTTGFYTELLHETKKNPDNFCGCKEPYIKEVN